MTPPPDGCPFCAYANGLAVPAGGLVHQDPATIVFEPLSPHAPGHLLVAPRIHVPDITYAHPDTVRDVMAAAVLTMGGMWAGGAHGANVLTSVGTAATQTVDHWHVHVIPRTHGDALGGWPWRT